MTYNLRSLLAGLAILATGAGNAAAQELRPVVFGTAALANVYRAEDQSFGTRLNGGAGAGIEWKRLGLEAEFHRTLGLRPREVPCSDAGIPCVGAAREGFLEATLLSGNISYVFGSLRARPYLTASVGVLWTEGVNSLTQVSDGVATLSEFHEKNAGLALGGGFGVDVPIAAGLSLRPEFRTFSSVAMSRVNLGLHRGAIGVRYRW